MGEVRAGDGMSTADAPWPVAELGNRLKQYIDRLGSVWVEGEITQWGVSAGNVYGKLKDLNEDVTVSFTIWQSVRTRMEGEFKQGDRVIANFKPNYWVKGGTLNMQVFAMRHVGLGDLLERLERLRKQLASEGLFDAARKKPLPFLPRRIGLITGKDSDAEKDVLRNAKLRWPGVQFRIEYAAVQGERTVPEVLTALAKLDADPEVDVIVIARGGGDFQNLLGFSDESLVRAVAAANTPIVSAIGHEADRPLLDEVADLRASTPTDAAKRIVPDMAEELMRIDQARLRLGSSLTNRLRAESDRIALLRSRPALADPSWIISSRAEELTRWVARGEELATRALESAARTQAELVARLRALSPEATLARGYTIAQRADGSVLRDAAAAEVGESLLLTLHRGAVRTTVSATESGNSPADDGAQN